MHFAPSEANLSAMAAPMPRDAPVIRAVLQSNNPFDGEPGELEGGRDCGEKSVLKDNFEGRKIEVLGKGE